MMHEGANPTLHRFLPRRRPAESTLPGSHVMPSNVFSRAVVVAVGLPLLLGVAPRSAAAQSGKWVATVSQLSSAGGAADLSIEPRNDKQSRARIVFRNTKRDMHLAWDIAEGNCRDEG